MTLLEENEERGVLWCQLSCDLARERLRDEARLQAEAGDAVGVAASILDHIVSDYETYGFRSVPEKYSQFFFEDASESGDDAAPLSRESSVASDYNDCMLVETAQAAPLSRKSSMASDFDDCMLVESSAQASPDRRMSLDNPAQSSGVVHLPQRKGIWIFNETEQLAPGCEEEASSMSKTTPTQSVVHQKQRAKFLSDSVAADDCPPVRAASGAAMFQTAPSARRRRENPRGPFLSDSATPVDKERGQGASKAEALRKLKEPAGPPAWMKATQGKHNRQ
jgi:hypothetical protein